MYKVDDSFSASRSFWASLDRFCHVSCDLEIELVPLTALRIRYSLGPSNLSVECNAKESTLILNNDVDDDLLKVKLIVLLMIFDE